MNDELPDDELPDDETPDVRPPHDEFDTTQAPPDGTRGNDGPTENNHEFSLIPVDASLEGLTPSRSRIEKADHDFIGRYRVDSVLGKGGFGRVYLAFDSGLDRKVAIKVPHLKRVTTELGRQRFVEEAKTLAKLDHPHIVPVYDVGVIKDGPFFVVSKYIEGQDLSQILVDGIPPISATVKYLIAIAEALNYLHKFRLMHRDVKPGNLVVGPEGRIYLVDFGLALHEEKFTPDEAGIGTPAYMSPEQLRGEGHRMDGRSDLFSLGVVMYEMLTGERPFRANTASESVRALLESDPVPVHQRNPAAPRELNRICMKLLSKRATDRYTNGNLLAEDLQHWLNTGAALSADESEQTVLGRSDGFSPTSSTFAPDPVVPRGLRSYGRRDAYFFIQLLPGVRDRDGLPESLSHWREWVREPGESPGTRSIGVISGPSGCGKSSLVRAGLLPLLNESVCSVILDASADDTESRLCDAIDRKVLNLDVEGDLADRFSAIRRGGGLPDNGKLLVVIDQFEQWLNGLHSRQDSELLDALRQCDGERVQCILLVRDDFWMALSRFMEEVEVPLVTGQNVQMVDLFDPAHARKVLIQFGRAFGRLPASRDALTLAHNQFLDRAISNLTQDGKVFPVHLALFSEMVKARDWEPKTLQDMGGAVGVGTQFLRESFTANHAPLKNRRHELAARRVLASLLPEPGVEIKASHRTLTDLCRESGYEAGSNQYHELMEVLESDLKIISPVDVLERMPSTGATTEAQGADVAPEKSYQLSHDFLVPSVREWLHAQQRSTYRGRLRLSLAEQAGIWNRQRQSRLLPTMLEWLQSRLLFWPGEFRGATAEMMQAADKLRGMQLVAGIVLALSAALGIQQYEVYRRANGLVAQLATAEIGQASDIIDDLESLQAYGERPVQNQLSKVPESGPRRLIFLMAALRWDSSLAPMVLEEAMQATSEEVMVARDQLAPYSSILIDGCWEELERGNSSPEKEGKRGLRAAQMLADWEPPSTPEQIQKWETYAPFIASQAVEECVTSPQQFDSILESISPLKDVLRPELEQFLGVEEKDVTSELTFAISLLSRLYANDKVAKTELVLLATPWQWKTFFASPDELAFDLVESVAFDENTQGVVAARRRATALSIVLKVHPKDVRAWSQLQFNARPDVRSNLIVRLPKMGVPIEAVSKQLNVELAPGSMQRFDVVAALLQILGAYPAPEPGSDLLTRVVLEWNSNPDPEVHSSAEWLLRTWAPDNRIENLIHGTLATEINREHFWRVTPKGHVMVRIDARGVSEIDRVFEISTTEISVKQHLDQPGYRYYNTDHAPTNDCPCNVVSWPDALEYCNWLTGELGLPESELCYPTDSAARKNWIPDEEHLSRTGYRLPRQQEWRLACRAGTKSSRFYGDDMRLGDFYAWHELNSLESDADGRFFSRSWPCGTLKPNRWGLFDMNGNVMEWCEDVSGDENQHRILCGGSHSFSIIDLHSDTSGVLTPMNGFNTAGYRIVRTLKGDEAELPAIKVK